MFSRLRLKNNDFRIPEIKILWFSGFPFKTDDFRIPEAHWQYFSVFRFENDEFRPPEVHFSLKNRALGDVFERLEGSWRRSGEALGRLGGFPEAFLVPDAKL